MAGAATFGRNSAPIDLPVDSIVVGKRLRALDEARVANYAVSMSENGFFGSILVRPIPPNELGVRYELVFGAHRLAAWKRTGHATIPAHVRALTDDEALQIEIDENLVRQDLTPLERAEHLAARYEVWSRRFPDRVDTGKAAPKRGRPGNSVNLTDFTAGAPQTMGFTTDTAAEVGLSKSTVERAFRVMQGVPADLRAKLHGTPLAKNDGLLRQLAALGDKAEQAKVADVLLRGETKNVSDARAIAAGNAPAAKVQTPVDETLKAFRALWGKASPSARAAILNELAGRSLPKGWSISEAGHD